MLALDIAVGIALSLVTKKEADNGTGILYEVQSQKGDERPQEHNHEEREAGDSRNVPFMRHQDVQNREELGRFPPFDSRQGQVLIQMPGLFLCTVHLG